MTSETWINLSFLIVLVFFCIYSVLDGFDLGIGMRIPWIKDPALAGRLIGLISPFWDGNEVWLVMGAGFLFAAFPQVFSALLSAYYLPFMMVAGAYLVRAAALEFSYHDTGRVQLWRNIFGVSSLAIVLGGLTAVGFFVQKLSMKAPGAPETGVGFFQAPFPYLFAVAGAAVTFWHGAAYARSQFRDTPTRRWPFRLSSLSILGLWTIIGIRLCPNALAEAAAPLSTLKTISVLALVMIPVILAYTAFVYRVFRKTKP